MKCAYRILVGKHEEIRLHERPRCRCGENIETDLKEIAREGVDWIQCLRTETSIAPFVIQQ
jgi:hypothetical protein